MGIGVSDSGTCLTQTSILMKFTIPGLNTGVNKKTSVRSFFIDFLSLELYELP